MGRENHDGNNIKGLLHPHLLDELLATHTWHDQVTKHEIRLQGKGLRETVLTILCYYHTVFRCKDINEEMGHIWMVFYYQHDGLRFGPRCNLGGLHSGRPVSRFWREFSQEWRDLFLRDNDREHGRL